MITEAGAILQVIRESSRSMDLARTHQCVNRDSIRAKTVKTAWRIPLTPYTHYRYDIHDAARDHENGIREPVWNFLEVSLD